MKKLNEYLTRDKAAKFLGVTNQTLINWEIQGKIKVYRNPINNYRLYKLEELEAILSAIHQELQAVLNEIRLIE